MVELGQEFFKEEERCGYLVSAKMKKIWALELEMLDELDRICKKHDLRYFADYGTLLGAVRHQGFVPWDDDIDVTMFRDDYEKLKLIINDELDSSYVFQNAYNGIKMWGFSKIRHSNSSAVEFTDADPSFNQGVFIDIFPLDEANDGGDVSASVVRMISELWVIIDNKEKAKEKIKSVPHRIMDDAMIDLFCQMDKKQVFMFLEKYLLENFGKSKRVNYFLDEILGLGSPNQREDYLEHIYLPFENTMIPAPKGYDNILKSHYGEYMEQVKGASCHSDIILDPDKPYWEYLDCNNKL